MEVNKTSIWIKCKNTIKRWKNKLWEFILEGGRGIWEMQKNGWWPPY